MFLCLLSIPEMAPICCDTLCVSGACSLTNGTLILQRNSRYWTSLLIQGAQLLPRRESCGTGKRSRWSLQCAPVFSFFWSQDARLWSTRDSGVGWRKTSSLVRIQLVISNRWTADFPAFMGNFEMRRCISNAHNLRKYIEYSKQHTRYNVTDESKSLLSFSFLLIINYVHLLLLTRRNEALWNDCTVGKLSSPSRALSEEEIFCNLKVAKRITLKLPMRNIYRVVSTRMPAEPCHCILWV